MCEIINVSAGINDYISKTFVEHSYHPYLSQIHTRAHTRHARTHIHETHTDYDIEKIRIYLVDFHLTYMLQIMFGTPQQADF